MNQFLKVSVIVQDLKIKKKSSVEKEFCREPVFHWQIPNEHIGNVIR